MLFIGDHCISSLVLLQQIHQRGVTHSSHFKSQRHHCRPESTGVQISSLLFVSSIRFLSLVGIFSYQNNVSLVLISCLRLMMIQASIKIWQFIKQDGFFKRNKLHYTSKVYLDPIPFTRLRHIHTHPHCIHMYPCIVILKWYYTHIHISLYSNALDLNWQI